MTQEQKDKYHAYGISAVFHIIVFILVALTGIFAQAAQEKRPAVDVTVYDMAADNGGGGGGGSPAPAPAAELPQSADAVVLPVETAKLPEIAEEYTKDPEKQQEYREIHKTADTPEQAFGTVGDNAMNSTASASGQGGEGGHGTGDGSGDSNGNGAGIGTGMGTGSGSGDGIGNGHGQGRDEAAAKRPKTPPRFLGGSEPRYPADLQEQGIGGTVLLRLTVTDDGRVASVEIAASSGYEALDNAAVRAAYSYSFAAARNVYDEPVMCIISKRIVFNP